jgi:hypothetical protein
MKNETKGCTQVNTPISESETHNKDCSIAQSTGRSPFEDCSTVKSTGRGLSYVPF